MRLLLTVTDDAGFLPPIPSASPSPTPRTHVGFAGWRRPISNNPRYLGWETSTATGLSTCSP